MKNVVIFISISINVFVVLAAMAAWSYKDHLLWGMVWAHAERQRSQFEVLSDRKVDVVFLGDSLTEGGRWNEYFPELHVVNRGISGDTTEDIINRFDQVVRLNPGSLFLMVGVNDVNRGFDASTTKTNVKRLFESIRVNLPETQVFIQSVLPVNDQWTIAANEPVRELNTELKELSSEYNFTYIDLHSRFTTSEGKLIDHMSNDGIHLLGEGYRIWSGEIAQYVKK